MITGLAAGLISSTAGFLFPILASFKALKANDPSQMTPWLMYWSIMGCLMFAEHWTYFLLQWIPLYKEAKMLFVLWMVLPQTQGATYLYLHYLHPQLVLHEGDLDSLIFTIHEQAMRRGAAQVQRILSVIREIFFGPVAKSPGASAADPSPIERTSYMSKLMSRFRTVPVGVTSETIPATLMGFISSYSRNLSYATSTQTPEEIIPSHLQPEERANYIALQKQKLMNWLQQLDQAMSQPVPNQSPHSLPMAHPEKNGSSTSVGSKQGKRRSVSGRQSPLTMTDSDFEDLGQDEVLPMRRPPVSMSSARAGSSSAGATPRQGWSWRAGRSASSNY